MLNQCFYGLGVLVYRTRWVIIALWLIAIMACVPFIADIMSPFKSTGFVDETSKSAKADAFLTRSLGYNSANQVMVIAQSKTLLATDPLFMHKIKQAFAPLSSFPLKHEVILPTPHNHQISQDKHTAYVVILFKGRDPISSATLAEFKSAIHPQSNMRLMFGGEPFFVEGVNQQTQIDLYHADFIATPVALVTLLLIFGSVVAALVPIVLGGGSALLILTMLYGLGHVLTLSIFTLNIALLLGLCLCLDYSLLIISRFRDELNQGADIQSAIAQSSATAGKAVFFSGIAVLASLSALFIFPITILFSVAVGGVLAVLVAMGTALIILPAILAVLNTRINRFSVNFCRRKRPPHQTIWHRVACFVTDWPRLFGGVTLLILLLAGYPFLSVKFGVSDYRILPKHAESRQFFNVYLSQFNENELSGITLIDRTQSPPILSKKNFSKVVDLGSRLQHMSLIERVDSIVTTKPALSQQNYYRLYHQSKKTMTPAVKQALSTTTGRDFVAFHIVSQYPKNSLQTTQLVNQLHHMKGGHGMRLELTGSPVSEREVLARISDRLPYALLWVFCSTYLILLILLRSLFLPLKAILMNLLSLSACYGALVLVFQEGYWHHWLMFEPQGMLDVSVFVIIFCALFGFSMDYEVFLLSRIKEEYELTHNNKKSIIFGIEKSARIITSAALIVMVICGSFLVAEVIMVKAFGLGVAVAIFVDAFLIRTLLVPSTMVLLQEWNWYCPQWLARILPR